MEESTFPRYSAVDAPRNPSKKATNEYMPLVALSIDAAPFQTRARCSNGGSPMERVMLRAPSTAPRWGGDVRRLAVVRQLVGAEDRVETCSARRESGERRCRRVYAHVRFAVVVEDW